MAKRKPRGPGEILSGWLALTGFTHKEGCRCKELAERMNENGPQWCRDNFESLLSSIQDSAREYGLKVPRAAIRPVLNAAIEASERELASD